MSDRIVSQFVRLSGNAIRQVAAGPSLPGYLSRAADEGCFQAAEMKV